MGVKPVYYLFNDGVTDIETEKKKYSKCGFKVVIITEGKNDMIEGLQYILNNHLKKN